ncbi:putative transcriptional regulator [Cylindrospermum stagnale PCC 7417]|uniref:Putative transcriptional regulator n=1 Tax=Cylindrospermum stagnale PCC 7417 TaxID=56107 RepID=K9WWK3_9NOST|nr:helix-turn-helix transcriptional regulator [Cylindrospermum stagnale]AFZ24765.1 putative transcriptional regulator [Cylindrospermum stagnale PCC 7417]
MTKQPERKALTPMSLRKKVNLTQRQVAQALDIQTQTVGGWEKGGIPHLPPSKIKKLCEVYQCSLDDLIEAFEAEQPVSAG